MMLQSLVDDAIAYHGPQLVDSLHEEQADVKLPNFLAVANLKAKTPDHPRNDAFEKKLCSFIGRKADMLFEKKSLLRTKPITHEQESNEEISVLPPLECFMNVPNSLRRDQFFQSVKEGDVLIGRISAIQESGLTVRIICCGQHQCRDIEDLQLAAFCSTRDVPRLFAHEAPLNGYAINDFVRGVALVVQATKDIILLSMRGSDWGSRYDDTKLGLITEDDLPLHYQKTQRMTGESYGECLEKSRAWNNEKSVEILGTSLGLTGLSPPPSLFRVFSNAEYPAQEYAESLRKTQSYRWALKSVAEGIRYFKQGKSPEAMQYLNKALQIDTDNVEALVARGALYANSESFERAIEDFEKALEVRPEHVNATKYMVETLLVHARTLLDADKESVAIAKLERILSIEPRNEEARRLLRRLHNKPQPPPDFKAESPDPEVHAPAADDMHALRDTADKLRSLMQLERSRKPSKRKRKRESSSETETTDKSHDRSFDTSSQSQSSKQKRALSRSLHDTSSSSVIEAAARPEVSSEKRRLSVRTTTTDTRSERSRADVSSGREARRPKNARKAASSAGKPEVNRSRRSRDSSSSGSSSSSSSSSSSGSSGSDGQHSKRKQRDADTSHDQGAAGDRGAGKEKALPKQYAVNGRRRSTSRDVKRSSSRDHRASDRNPFTARYKRKSETRAGAGDYRREVSSSSRRRDENRSRSNRNVFQHRNRSRSRSNRRRSSSRSNRRRSKSNRRRSNSRSSSVRDSESASPPRKRVVARSSREASERRTVTVHGGKARQRTPSSGDDTVRRNIKIQRSSSQQKAKASTEKTVLRKLELPDILVQVYDKQELAVQSKWDSPSNNKAPVVMHLNEVMQLASSQQETGDVIGQQKSKRRSVSRGRRRKSGGARAASQSSSRTSSSPEKRRKQPPWVTRRRGGSQSTSSPSSPLRKARSRSRSTGDKRRRNASSSKTRKHSVERRKQSATGRVTSRRSKRRSSSRSGTSSTSSSSSDDVASSRKLPNGKAKANKESRSKEELAWVKKEEEEKRKQEEQRKQEQQKRQEKKKEEERIKEEERLKEEKRKNDVARKREEQKLKKEESELADMEGFLSMLKQKKKSGVQEETPEKKKAPERLKLW